MTRMTQPVLRTSLIQSPRLPVLAAVAIAFAYLVTVWDTRRRSRNHLSQLDDHLLRDIGVTPHQALKEAKRPFWLP